MSSELIVDLHVHSRFARATSKYLTPETLYYWGKIKGINIIGTGDFTHPLWFAELHDKLVPAEGGVLQLRHDLAQEVDKTLPLSVRNNLLRFVPSVEIATIYTKSGRGRRLHQLVILPSLETVSRFNSRLERLANLKADGRPIIGMDSKELLRLALETDSDALYVPAHIWTPWFGLFGSKSGFDSIVEACDELAPEIKAIETGLSSDPPMNWQLDQLEHVAIISASDAHSPQKLGREATIITGEPTYADIIGAIKTNDTRLTGTIEFFPEEGMYHYDGHREHGVKFAPAETKKLGGICPVCHKPLTIGVDHRVEELADRPLSAVINKKVMEYIVPLIEVIAELKGVKSVGGKAVVDEYEKLIAALGDEFSIVRKLPLDVIREYSPHIAVAVERIRTNQVYRDPGYDGVYGTIRVFKDAAERAETLNQLSLL